MKEGNTHWDARCDTSGLEGTALGVREGNTKEQYLHHPNLHISDIPEVKDQITNELVIATMKKKGLEDIGVSDLEKSHRLGQKTIMVVHTVT